MDIHKIINLKSKPRPINEYTVHFKPFNDSFNVRCLNGSAHARKTTNINEVTCFKCLNPHAYRKYWGDYEAKNGNEHKN